MAGSYSRNITIYINGKEVENNIKSIRGEMKRLINEQAKMTRGSDEYNKHAKEIRKLDGILQNHRAELKGSQNIWGKITGTLGKLGFAAGGAFAAIKAGKFIMQSTQVLSDKWDQTLSAVNTSLDYVARSISTMDFSNFFKNLGNAIRVGKEYAETLDEIGDRNRALAIQEADYRREVLENMKVLRDEMSTNKERIKAADRIIEIEDIIAKKKAENARMSYKNEVERSLVGIELSEQELENYLRNYDNLSENIKLGQEYNELLRKEKEAAYELGVSLGSDEAVNKLSEIREQIAGATEDQISWGRIVLETKDINDETRATLVKNYTDMKDAENQALENTQRVSSRKSSLLAENTRNEKKNTDETIKGQDDILKKRQEVLQEFQDIIDEQYRLTLTENEREIEDIRRKYKKIIEEAIAAGVSIQRIKGMEIARDKAIAALEEKHRTEREAAILKATKDFEKAKADIKLELEELTLEQLKQHELDALQEKYDAVSDLLAEQREEDIITEEEEIERKLQATKLLEDSKAEIEQQYRDLKEEKDNELRQKQLDAISDHLAQVEAITQLSLNAVNTFRDADLTKLETQKEKELVLAGDNADKKEKIELDYAEKEKAIKKKYADVQFGIAIAQIIANTASAIVNTWKGYADMGPVGTALAVIQTAALVALGAAQTATAVQQRNSVKQLARGKYPVRGADDGRTYYAPYHGPVTDSQIFDRPTLISERGGELVATAEHVRRVQRINPEVLNSFMSYKTPQRAEGSYPVESASSGVQKTLILSPEMVNLFQRLNTALSKGITAHVSYQEIKAAAAEMNEIENYASGDKNPIVGWAIGGPPIMPVYKFKK